MRTRISRAVLDAIRAEARASPAFEVCGLLLGSSQTIDGWLPARNVAERPAIEFEIDPAALFAVLRAERVGGPCVAGYWHSHPTGDASPSATDCARAPKDGKVWLIVAADAVRAWCAEPGGFREVLIEVD